MFQRLLVPVDFGPAEEHARELAIDIALKFDAKLELVHAFYVPPIAYAQGAYLPLDAMMADARKLLDGVLQTVRQRCPRAEALWAEGEPRHCIVELAKKRGADLIVMGTHGRRGVSRALLGSVAETVVRTSPVPVLTAAASAGEVKAAPASFRQILVPTDFGEPAERALAIATALAAKFDAKITLVHAYVTPPIIYDNLASWPADEIQRDANAALGRALELARERYGAVDAVLVGGDPGERILEVAHARNADLIVMGTHGRRGLSRVFLGSVAERIVRTSRIPVLTASH